ncbi:DUF6291 domain-containing protein [Acidaminococcus intestini]|uniref:DUF6291 domain-containing protein n=1 Tax=Acidaminococcus intestini TaxID=187327 RepID=UPI0027BA09C9|nr:DUF6291 domain-containing protein [Acidaminococcus intestini]
MAREYFPAYHSYLEAMEELTDAEKGRLFTACLLYSKTGEAPQLSGNERYLFPAFRSQIDRDNEEYAKKCAKNRKNGELGGKRTGANGSERGQTPPERPPNAPQGKGKEEGKEKGKGKGERIPPTPLPGGSPALQNAFAAWVRYKHEKRQDYKPTGLQSLVAQVQKAAETYGEQAVIDLIGECMANNWQGIIFDRLKSGQAPRRGGNVFLDIAREEGIV